MYEQKHRNKADEKLSIYFELWECGGFFLGYFLNIRLFYERFRDNKFYFKFYSDFSLEKFLNIDVKYYCEMWRNNYCLYKAFHSIITLLISYTFINMQHTSGNVTVLEDIIMEIWESPCTQKSESRSTVSNSLQPHGLYSPWNSPGQNTGVGSLSLHPGDLPNPGIEPRSPSLQADSLPAEPQRKPCAQ